MSISTGLYPKLDLLTANKLLTYLHYKPLQSKKVLQINLWTYACGGSIVWTDHHILNVPPASYLL